MDRTHPGQKYLVLPAARKRKPMDPSHPIPAPAPAPEWSVAVAAPEIRFNPAPAPEWPVPWLPLKSISIQRPLQNGQLRWLLQRSLVSVPLSRFYYKAIHVEEATPE
jgi:hypothetical protein